MRAALIGFGGPVTAALVEQLGAVPGLADRLDLHLVPPGAAADPALLARAAVVLDETGAPPPVACPVIRLPPAAFASLWPLMAEHPPRPDIPAIPAPFGDRIALRILRAGGDRAAYDAVALDTLVDLDRLHAFEARDMFRREAGCDIRIAAFVLSRFRAERLFHSAVHPAAPVLEHMLAQLLGHPALAAEPYDAALAAVRAGLAARFADAQAPIHPAVAAHFALAWWSPTLRYRQGAQEHDAAGWTDRLLRRQAPPPALILGPPLADRPGAEALHPAAEIARVAPFFATPIDPAIARHGAALLSPDSGRYTAPATHRATLAEAVILGATGAVLHDGTVLSDSVPPGTTGVPAPTSPGQRLEAPALLGFGPGWTADPGGLATILPRLLLFARQRRHQPELVLLLPEAAAPALRPPLALLGIPDAAIRWLADAPLLCARLTLAGPLGTAAVSPLAAAAARALATLVPVTSPGPTRLYLASAAAAPANAPLVAATLAARGFTLIDADTTPLPERIALLRDATSLVAAQGPALAELAFCPPGAIVLELTAAADPTPLFWSLASCAGLRYGYIVGDERFTVPLDMLDRAVAMMEGK